MSSTFATPMLWLPGMESEQVESQLDQMIDRAVATCAWLDGKMPTGEFLDLLHYHGLDVYDLADGWESGLIYL